MCLRRLTWLENNLPHHSLLGFSVVYFSSQISNVQRHLLLGYLPPSLFMNKGLGAKTWTKDIHGTSSHVKPLVVEAITAPLIATRYFQRRVDAPWVSYVQQMPYIYHILSIYPTLPDSHNKCSAPSLSRNSPLGESIMFQFLYTEPPTMCSRPAMSCMPSPPLRP